MKVFVLTYITKDDTSRRIVDGVYSSMEKLDKELGLLRRNLGNILHSYEIETFPLDA